MTADIIPFTSDYDDYLHDESRRIGSAKAVAFPTTEDEVMRVVKQAGQQGLAITVQGARTGIVAGAVPENGLVLNLSRMNSIAGCPQGSSCAERCSSVVVQPGVLLSDVRQAVEPKGLFFPPDPTETSASIGGMVACNASGAMSFRYGATRKWVSAIRVVLSDGDVVSIRRGECRAQGRLFSITTEGGRVIEGKLPSYTMPDVKSAAGYYAADDMDLMDLLIGSEGTLGVITEIELQLVEQPKAINGLTLFLPSVEAVVSLVRLARGEAVDGFEPLSMRPSAIEFFNNDALDLLRKAKVTYPAFEGIPVLKDHYHSALYLEFHAEDSDEIEAAVMELMDAVVTLGGSDEDTWFATTDREMEPIKAFRHAIPEAVNLLIDQRKHEHPDLTKLGTDMSVPDAKLGAVIAMYDAGLRANGLESVIFGHIGNNHVHVNILPRDMEDYAKGKELYLSWASEVVSMGGSVSAEHGIGKLKAPFLRTMYGEHAIEEMRLLKRLFDPTMALDPGVMFTV